MDESIGRIRVGLGCAIVGAAIWAATQWRSPTMKLETATPPARASAFGLLAPSDSVISEALGRFIERLPFDDPAVGVEAVLAEPEPPTNPVAPSPMEALVVRGVVLGVVGEAIIDGIPGDTQSRTLRIGEQFGGVLLVRVSSSGAVVQMDQERRELRLPGGAR